MRFVIQRVTYANIKVSGRTEGRINKGFLVFLGVSDQDDEQVADKMVGKLIKMRIFTDNEGKTNLSLKDVGGELLIISQFTLYANCEKGNRPSFTDVGSPEHANALYKYVVAKCMEEVDVVEQGVFGAEMKVELLNDGPFTIVLDSNNL